ncbi:hypothetical protein LTS13_010194 [Exophiala xenobiotica]|nr:hypothetical protein LTS13_010194 [Exophiala xenobiotica]KAK5512425.1 hypothetical protein LTR07_009034 [Exophiala xenobiotica]
MGNSPSRGYSEFVSSDNHQHRRGRSSHRRRRSGSHGIPPPAPSPPPAYQEYPVPRSPPRSTRTTPGGYTYTTRGLSPIREQRRPSPIRRTTSPWRDPLRREPRRVYVTRPHDDPMFFMSGARGPSNSPPPARRAGAAAGATSPPRRRVYVDDDPWEGPSSRAGGPRPSTYYDRPDTNGFRPRRDAFDTGFGLGSGSGPSYTRSGGGGGAGGLYDRPRPLGRVIGTETSNIPAQGTGTDRTVDLGTLTFLMFSCIIPPPFLRANPSMDYKLIHCLT